MNELAYTIVVASLGGVMGLLLGILIARSFEDRRQIRNPKQAGTRMPETMISGERRRLRDIYNLISSITSTLKYQRVLDTALDLSGQVLSSDNSTPAKLVSAVMLFSKANGKHPQLTVGSARHFTPTDMRAVLPGSAGLVGQVLETGEAQINYNAAQDPELKRIVAMRACRVAYCLPLRAGLDTYGVLVFAHPDQNFFTQAQRELLDIISHQAVIAIQNARLYSDLEQEKNRMLEIQEEARRKLARDLHDGPTQSVAAIAMRLNFVRRLVERDPQASAVELGKVEELARKTIKEIRHMLFTLRPLVLESQGLIPALEAMADKTHETYNQQVFVEAEPNVASKLEINKQSSIFYIAEEAVTNARKHAKAANIWVRLKPLDEHVVLLEVQDDGVGFNRKSLDSDYDQRGSLGMINMRERAELVNGLFEIQSGEGQGTIVRVAVPVTEKGVERLQRGG